MRSETPSMLVTFALVLGIFLWVAIGAAIVTGRIQITKQTSILRDEQPGPFWACVIIGGGIATVALIYGALRFGPGG